MKFLEAISSYLPSLVVAHVAGREEGTLDPPFRQSLDTVCLFADVSGFTKLSEAMANKFGPEGAEFVAKHLNSYFCQMIRIISGEGGDIFKFAGDAVIVLWPDVGDMAERARHAAQCALNVQGLLDAAELEEDVSLSVKIGVGIGPVSVLHLGGENGRLEYVAVGAPLMQAFNCEHHGTSGEVILSKETWDLIGEHFDVRDDRDGGLKVISGVKPGHTLRRRNIRNLVDSSDSEGGADATRAPADEDGIVARLLPYVPGAIQSVLSADDPDLEQWGDELRQLTVIFVNLGLRDHDLLAASDYEGALLRCHHALTAVQGAVYRFEGTVNKFLMDDKGSTLIAVWGLPPHAHEDDPTRSCLAAIDLCSALADLGLAGSVGITTGVAFCGVVGTRTRREYSVLGDMVNLSARLMQLACTKNGGVICDATTVHLARRGMEFEQLTSVKVKGKADLIDVFHPYTEEGAATRGTGLEVKYSGILADQCANLHRAKLSFVHDGFAELSDFAAATPRGTLAPPPLPPAAITIGVPCNGASWKLHAPHTFSTASQLPEGWRAITHTVVLSPKTGDTTTLMRAACDAVRASSEYTTSFAATSEDATTSGNPLLNDVEWQVLGTDIFLPPLAKACPLEWLATLLRDTPPPSLTSAAGVVILVPTPRGQRRWRQSHYNLALQKIVSSHFTVTKAEEGGGCCLMVEGPAGAGKTHFASYCIALFESMGQVRVGSGCGYAHDVTPFTAWRAVCTQWLDELDDDGGEMPSATRRQASLRRLLGPTIGTQMLPHLAVLNWVTSTEFAMTREVGRMSVDQQHGTTRVLVLALIRALCKVRPMFIFLDDATLLDPSSWDLCLDIATDGASLLEGSVRMPIAALSYERAYHADLPEGTAAATVTSKLPVVLVLMTRPSSYCFGNAANSTPVPQACVELNRMATTHRLILAPMHTDTVRDLLVKHAATPLHMGGSVWNPDPNVSSSPVASKGSVRRRSILKVGGAPADAAAAADANSQAIVALATSHSQGNMQRGINLLETMRLRPDKVPTLEITAAMSPKAVLALAREVKASALPFPIPMYGTLGSRLDCATVCGQIIMKVGSMLGGQFKLRQLRDAWPLPRLIPSLERELVGLSELNLLTCVRLKPEPEYAFIDVWEKLTVQRRLTSKQRAHVDRKKAREEVDHHKEVRRKMYEATKKMGVAANVSGVCNAMVVDSETNNARRRASAHTNLFAQIKSLGRLVNEWKKLSFFVENDLLLLTKKSEGRDSISGASKFPRALYAIGLRHCHLVASNEYHHHKSIIEITSSIAFKEGREQTGVHIAYISLENDEARDDLLYKLQFAVESIDMREADEVGAADSKRASMKVLKAAIEDPEEEDDEDDDEPKATVVIDISAARNLITLHPLELQSAYGNVVVEVLSDDGATPIELAKKRTALDGQVAADLVEHRWDHTFTVPKINAYQLSTGAVIVTILQQRTTTMDGIFGSVRIPLAALLSAGGGDTGASSAAPEWMPVVGKGGRTGGEVQLKVEVQGSAGFAEACVAAATAATVRAEELELEIARAAQRAKAVQMRGLMPAAAAEAGKKALTRKKSIELRQQEMLGRAEDAESRVNSARAWAMRRLAVVRQGGAVGESDIAVLLAALGASSM